MFNNLLESKPKKQRQTGGTVASIVMHSLLVGLAVYATANAASSPQGLQFPEEEPPPRGFFEEDPTFTYPMYWWF